MTLHDFIVVENIAPSPGVLAETLILPCVYPAPFCIISIEVIVPLLTLAFAFAPTPSPVIIISGVLEKLSPPCLIII